MRSVKHLAKKFHLVKPKTTSHLENIEPEPHVPPLLGQTIGHQSPCPHLEPHLPPELERVIFRLAAELCLKDIIRLALVAKRVHEWVMPVLTEPLLLISPNCPNIELLDHSTIPRKEYTFITTLVLHFDMYTEMLELRKPPSHNFPRLQDLVYSNQNTISTPIDLFLFSLSFCSPCGPHFRTRKPTGRVTFRPPISLDKTLNWVGYFQYFKNMFLNSIVVLRCELVNLPRSIRVLIYLDHMETSRELARSGQVRKLYSLGPKFVAFASIMDEKGQASDEMKELEAQILRGLARFQKEMTPFLLLKPAEAEDICTSADHINWVKKKLNEVERSMPPVDMTKFSDETGVYGDLPCYWSGRGED